MAHHEQYHLYLYCNVAHAVHYFQVCLRRHLTQRCEDACADPAHAGFVTYTPRKVPCYFATHAHPQRITCLASRGEYFLRAFTKMAPRFS